MDSKINLLAQIASATRLNEKTIHKLCENGKVTMHTLSTICKSIGILDKFLKIQSHRRLLLRNCDNRGKTFCLYNMNYEMKLAS